MASWSELAWFWFETIKNELYPGKAIFTTNDYPDISGQVWIVTGSTSGIGLEVATKLAQQNAKVWIMGRNQTKIDAALSHIRELVPNANIDYILADLSDLTTIKPGVKKFLAAESKLDGVIHNAGVNNQDQVPQTCQHIDFTLGVNNVGPQLLQKLLDPVILQTPGARIVWVSSVAHAMAPPGGFDLTKLNVLGLNQFRRYSESKALTLAQAVQWSHNHPKAQVQSVAVHPGYIRTHIGSTIPLERYLDYLRWPVEYGGLAPLYAALSPKIDFEYIIPWGRPGQIRPDIYRSVHGFNGASAWKWLEDKVALYA